MKFSFAFLIFCGILVGNGYDLSPGEVKVFPFPEIDMIETNEVTGLEEIAYNVTPEISDNKMKNTPSWNTTIIVFLITVVAVTILIFKLVSTKQQSRCWDVTKKCNSRTLKESEEETVCFLNNSRSEECLITMDSLDDYTITY
ncbi:unnamed protein product [Caenorhabditis nigoni]